MTTTEHIESFKANLQSPAKNIARGLSRRALLGMVGVLTMLFLLGMVPRWHANASLLDATRDQRPTVSVVSSQGPDGAAHLVLPGSTQAIQEAAIYARTNGYVRKWYTDIGAKVEAGGLLAEIETPEIDQELNQARATVQQAVANSELARATLTRWQELVAKKVVSAQEFDEKKSALDARQADLTAAQANVVRTAGALDPASRTLLTELQVANSDGQLFPGMYAEVKFAFPQDARTLLVPGNAVTVQSDGPKVLIVDAKQTIRARSVKLGRDLGDKVEILSGLNPAEMLVANPSGSLREGEEVKSQPQPIQAKK